MLGSMVNSLEKIGLFQSGEITVSVPPDLVAMTFVLAGYKTNLNPRSNKLPGLELELAMLGMNQIACMQTSVMVIF